MSKILLETQNLRRVYKQADEELEVLRGVNFKLQAGEIVALVGSSGSGKSTLLQSIGLLDKASSGSIYIDGQDVSNLNDQQRTLLRRHYLGFVYQFHYLQAEFSALENIIIPQMICGVSKAEATIKALDLLKSMGVEHRAHHRPARLSGGEQQRVAIARALANNPKVLLADEPTGNLDPKTSDAVFDILISRVRDSGVGAIIATHNLELAKRMDRILELKDGQVKVN